ncbi:hypothetical protein DV736_g3796, partial [Chaetothyriales sp. CBS 134916]
MEALRALAYRSYLARHRATLLDPANWLSGPLGGELSSVTWLPWTESRRWPRRNARESATFYHSQAPRAATDWASMAWPSTTRAPSCTQLSSLTCHWHFPTRTLHWHFPYALSTGTFHTHPPLALSIRTLHWHFPYAPSTRTFHTYPPLALSIRTLHWHFPYAPSTRTFHTYTGGRDGVICAWDVDIGAQQAQPPDSDDDSHQTNKSTASFRKQVQAHTDWVNDIVPVENNQGLVSCSSDGTVKLWRPFGHDSAAAATIGAHSDYIKCLATPGAHAGWVASGGLDHRICLWDLNGSGKTLEINVGRDYSITKGSIYALQATGPLLASGGPEGVVRLWDANSGKSVTKFVGHTDNVRDILISHDQDTVLSASSDQTIKVWSVTAGRCLHTLTMHNDSIWCMYSDDPNLAVFYSGDKSGLVAKTDTRRAMEIEEGVSVAVCQDNHGIAKIVTAGKSIWTATSSSSVNRWNDVDTTLQVETPAATPHDERGPSALSKHNDDDDASHAIGQTNGLKARRIPQSALLLLASTAIRSGRRSSSRLATSSLTNLRKASEAIIAHSLTIIVPMRPHPAETIQGQHGLIKHTMLNDRKRILTLDTAGEVVLWDLLKCVPIKSFGRRHLDEVVAQVNTTDSVANWCTVDTKTGTITVQLQENYCFDAEVYADQIDTAEKVDFRTDQRINLGKWVLRNLFTTLLDEEMQRDKVYRQSLQSSANTPSTGLRPNAPGAIELPGPLVHTDAEPTPKAADGPAINPHALGMNIGAATPGPPLTSSVTSTPQSQPSHSPRPENGTSLDPTAGSHMSLLSSTADAPSDYFSANESKDHSETASEDKENKTPATPGGGTGPTSLPTSPTEEKKKSGLFGMKFQMGFPKKAARQSTEAKAEVKPEEISDSASSRSSDKEEKVIEDNFYAVVQRIRAEYDEHYNAKPDEPLPPGITPSLPIETPVLHPPPHTLVIIQEDDPASGGLLDQYRGEISELGKEADTLEKIAPTWLAELLLKNQIPLKDTVKVSFILLPFENLLPSIASVDGNARLNANRMLRSKKILAYVAERIEAPPVPPATTDDTDTVPPAADPASDLKPEDYLELYCQGQKVDPNMTLATLRAHVWRTAGDVVLYYKSNGKKPLRLPHPADVPTSEESGETTGVGR